jgi:hypothetical protein
VIDRGSRPVRLIELIKLIERTELVSGERSVTVCIAVRGIERGRMM